MSIKQLILESIHKVDEMTERDITFAITFYDDELGEDIDGIHIKGKGTIVGIHTSGTIDTYRSSRHGDDEMDYTEDDYDDAEFEISKETELAIAKVVKSLKMKEVDRDYAEFNLKKGKVDLTVMVKKI